MKTLQEYLLEQYEVYNDNIQEGEVWDAIKNWFKNLFEPNKELKFDRYNFDDEYEGEFKSDKLEEYKQYIENNFDLKNCKVKQINLKELKNIVCPNNIKPNESDEYGFYNFLENVDKNIKDQLYFGIIYLDKEVKDTIALISIENNNGIFNIIKYQIIKEYQNKLTIKLLINIFENSDIFKKNCQALVCKKTTDNNLYNQLINDCDFNKETINNENIAIKKYNKK